MFSKVRARIAALFSEVLNERGVTYAQTGLRGSTVSTLLHGTGDLKLSTLVDAAEALNCDLVINLRDRGSR